MGKVPLRLTTIEEASPGSKVFLFEEDCKGTMGTGTVVVHIMDPAVETLLSDSNPFRRMSCTNERSECFSGTLRSRDDNRARLRMAASLPLTGLKYWKERTQNEIITPWKLTKMFQFWHSPPIVVLLKLTCLVCNTVCPQASVCQKLAKIEHFWHFQWTFV